MKKVLYNTLELVLVSVIVFCYYSLVVKLFGSRAKQLLVARPLFFGESVCFGFTWIITLISKKFFEKLKTNKYIKYLLLFCLIFVINSIGHIVVSMVTNLSISNIMLAILSIINTLFITFVCKKYVIHTTIKILIKIYKKFYELFDINTAECVDENYDVLILYKKPDFDGVSTVDTEMVEKLDTFLTKKGIKTLSINNAYEHDFIDKTTIDKIPLLVIVGSSLQNINFKFIKEQWESFEDDISKGKRGQIIPYVSNIKPDELPASLRSLRIFDKGLLDAEKLSDYILNILNKNKHTHFEPYEGKEPYIFISYSHKDIEEMTVIVNYLFENGYRVWFDEGIDPGTEWDDNIANHIDGCFYFISLISNNSINSKNCLDELSYARDLEKNRLVVYLEDVELPSGLKMRINRLQNIHKYQYKNQNTFFKKLLKTENIAQCKKENYV